jgi:hypothetical protein
VLPLLRQPPAAAACRRAMELDGHQLLRRYLKVGYAQPKKE